MAETKGQGNETVAASPAGTAPGASPPNPTAGLEKAAKRDYMPYLESSHAWTALTDGLDMRYGAGSIEGPESGLKRQHAGRLLALARNVLEANGFTVEGEYEPNLVIRVL